jgi:hypothetical protein
MYFPRTPRTDLAAVRETVLAPVDPREFFHNGGNVVLAGFDESEGEGGGGKYY